MEMSVVKMRLLLVLVLSLLVTSCIPYKQIDIEYYDKPSQPLPAESGKFLIVANLYNRDLADKRAQMEWALDSVAATEATNALGEIIASSPLYSNVQTINRIVFRSDTSKVINPLSWNAIDNLSKQNDSVSLVISLDYIKVNPTADYYPRWDDGVKSYYGYLDVPIYAYWRVYNPVSRKISNGYLYRDTLSWDATDFIEVRPGNQLPGYFSASAYAGADVAEKYAKQFAPIWNKDNRIFFNTGSSLMVQAEKYAIEGNWIDAALIWQVVAKDKNSILAAKAAFNMALANEMLGNFDIALDWLKEAKQLDPNIKEINNYQEIIEDRIEANK